MSRIHLIMLTLVAALWGGCASTPSGITPGSQTLISFQVQLRGPVDPNDYYYFVIDTDNNPSTGPVPVVARPWGNGYATGSYTHYILLHQGRFGVYQSADPNHTESTYLGPPLQAGLASTNQPNDTIIVQIDRAQIAGVHPDVRSLDVNVITTDIVPTDPQAIVDKTVDAFGALGLSYVTVPLTYTMTYTAADLSPSDPELPNDAPGLATHPSLDLINWRIIVQTNQ